MVVVLARRTVASRRDFALLSVIERRIHALTDRLVFSSVGSATSPRSNCCRACATSVIGLCGA